MSDSPDKFNWTPNATQAEIEKRRAGALKHRHEQLLNTVRAWNAQATSLGYEGVEAMLAAFHQSAGSSRVNS